MTSDETKPARSSSDQEQAKEERNVRILTEVKRLLGDSLPPPVLRTKGPLKLLK